MYKSLTTLLAVLAIVLAGSTYYFYDKLAAVKKNPQIVTQEEAAQLTAVVGKLMMLPEGEVPTVATVTDPELLKEQEFFVSAKKGDKVLIYTNAKKAILYNPKTHKIVNVAPVVIGPSEQAPNVPAAAVTEEENTENL